MEDVEVTLCKQLDQKEQNASRRFEVKESMAIKDAHTEKDAENNMKRFFFESDRNLNIANKRTLLTLASCAMIE